MKKRLFFFLMFVWCLLASLYGCTAAQKQKTLCYSGCVLRAIPACVKQCQQTSTAQRFFSVAPQSTLQRARELQKKELKSGKTKKGKLQEKKK